MSIRTILKTAAVVVVTMAIVNRVPAARQIVGG